MHHKGYTVQALQVHCGSCYRVVCWGQWHKGLGHDPPSDCHHVQAFKDGDVRFLICTDVAARGIDIQGLPYVVNMTLPDRRVLALRAIRRISRPLGVASSRPCAQTLARVGRVTARGHARCRSEDYIHRVGRVGRAEALGLAISLVATVEEKVSLTSALGRP